MKWGGGGKEERKHPQNRTYIILMGRQDDKITLQEVLGSSNHPLPFDTTRPSYRAKKLGGRGHTQKE
jgi:hypothetical protein